MYGHHCWRRHHSPAAACHFYAGQKIKCGNKKASNTDDDDDDAMGMTTPVMAMKFTAKMIFNNPNVIIQHSAKTAFTNMETNMAHIWYFHTYSTPFGWEQKTLPHTTTRAVNVVKQWAKRFSYILRKFVSIERKSVLDGVYQMTYASC